MSGCETCPTGVALPHNIQCRECFHGTSLAADTEAGRDAEVGDIVRSAVRLPAKFYFDHRDRDLPSGRVVRSSGRSVWVDLDRAAIDDLRDDAAHYAQEPEYGDLVSAARSMIRALDRQDVR